MAALTALLLTLGLYGCGADPEPAAPELRPVRTATVSEISGGQARTFSGTVRAGVDSLISFRVAGTIEELPVQVGDTVRKGAVIARLDPRDYQIAVQQAEASLAQVRAQARQASADRDRVEALYENDNTSKNELDAARAADESFRAQVRAAESVLEQTRLQLEDTRLRAPRSGAIAEVMVEVNENVAAGHTVVRITGQSRQEVAVAVPEGVISRISRGDPATVSITSLPGETFPATVREVGVASVGTVTTFPVTVQLEEMDRRIRSGMAANAEFQLESGDGEGVLMVPLSAVGEDRDGRFVLLAEPAAEAGLGAVRRRSVTVGEVTADGLEVTGGIAAGERVITAGLSQLSDGQQVRLDNGTGE
jgi:RND family efflux transporter MFP subunit